ncbi:MAG: sigma 54-interacting transcriptional regulator, partial [Desulfobacteraceae bacterium]
MMRAKASSLLLLDEKTKKLYFKVATGDKGEEIRKFEISLGQGIAGWVALTAEPLLIPDVTNDARWYKEISDSIGFETRSIACVPMKVEGEVIGVMEIIDKENGEAIVDEDMKTLTAFADLASLAISNARRIHDVERENRDLREELEGRNRLVGESHQLKKVISDALKVANSKTSILILGESGTGKELLARLIHGAGPRRHKPMITLNCAALPEGLMEAELFGYEKGAFTGAVERRRGKIESADGGTLFLDEIGEMSAGMQVKLLRVIQEGVFYRVGGNTPINVDIRILSATNRDIDRDVAEGRFREDLFYRLNVIRIRIPPLRERKEDIPLIARHYLEEFKRYRGLHNLSISMAALERMLDYDWPGNVRELRNALERAAVMGNGREVLPEDLPISGHRPRPAGVPLDMGLKQAVDNFKKELIVQNLQKTGGNRVRAAKALGIQRTYLSRLISRYGLQDL